MLLFSGGDKVAFWLPLVAENKDITGCDCGSTDGALVGLNRFNGILVGNSSSSKLDRLEAKLGKGVVTDETVGWG